MEFRNSDLDLVFSSSGFFYISHLELLKFIFFGFFRVWSLGDRFSGYKQWMHSAAFCRFAKNINRKKAVQWPKIVKSSVSKNSSNGPNFPVTVFRRSSGNRQKAAEFVSTERTLRCHNKMDKPLCAGNILYLYWAIPLPSLQCRTDKIGLRSMNSGRNSNFVPRPQTRPLFLTEGIFLRFENVPRGSRRESRGRFCDRQKVPEVRKIVADVLA